MIKAILDEMQERKARGRNVFAIGILNKDAIAIDYDSVTGKDIKRMIKAGTTVLITTLSNLGDLGIRDYDLTYYSHAYVSNIDPQDIEDVEFVRVSNGLGQ